MKKEGKKPARRAVTAPNAAAAVGAREAPAPDAPFPIVGIGASAGGLEAFTQLLGALPLDTGMGFVLVQHLDPDHESALTQILARATGLPVHEIADQARVQPNHVYIIPPDTNLRIAGGLLQTQPRTRTRTPYRPIDAFFESMAEDLHERAVGVVLSGTATDGTLGLEAIKAEGGITFAQDASAKYDSMPRSAVAAGCVDLVLSPAEIAQELARIAKHPFVKPARIAAAPALAPDPDVEAADPAGEPDGYRKILLLLRNHSGVDFSLYKRTTIQRRVTRRLVLARQNTLEDYAGFLRGNAKELDALYADVLISVTTFFRNPETFELLEHQILPALLAQRGDEPLRCWVLGCSTGQEAYSLAMVFTEVAERLPRMRRLQIFATDLNDALLEKARHGLYARTLADGLTPERLKRFFVEEDGGYRVSKALREKVVFARQNLIADPPFSRLDLISCRNLLIYLEPGLQRKAIPTFHFALKPGGVLLLGASESIGGFTDLFEPVDKKHKIFVKKPAPVGAVHLPMRRVEGDAAAGPRPLLPMPPVERPGAAEAGGLDAQREADRITVHQFAPPGVLVNAELQVLQFRGPTGAFLEPPVGKASFDVLKMARDGLMLPLRKLLHQAQTGDKTARKRNVLIKRGGKTRAVNLEVVPLKHLRDRERCFLILFEEVAPAEGAGTGRPARAARAGRAPAEATDRIAALEAELAEMREYLQSMQEQHDATHEEVQATNEEIQSANEELQSVNEELETSKEELESANEELTTVNDEMSNRNLELNRLNSDLVNLQTSTRLAIVLCGRDLTIRRFSPQAEKQFDLLAADVGRPIGHLRHGLLDVERVAATASDAWPRMPAPKEVPLDLEALVTEVITEVREQEREVRDHSGRWRSLRVRPYLSLDNKVDGAVLVLVDIDTLKRSEQAVAAARDYAANTVDTVREPLLVLDHDLCLESANRAFYRAFRVTPAETIGRPLYELDDRRWDIPRLRELLAEVARRDTSIEDFEIVGRAETAGPRTMLLNARRIQDPQRDRQRILIAIEDVTERKRLERELRQHAADLTAAADRRNEFLAMLGHELRNPLAALALGVEALTKLSDDRERLEVREMMARQTQRIGALLDQLLDIARVASGKVELANDPVDLSEIVRAAVETVSALVATRHHELTLTLPPPDSVFVLGDAIRLTQVVENLLANAAKYTDAGGRIALTVEADAVTVRIILRDNGTGMSAELLPLVFDPFTQSPRTLDRAQGGLGLGLPLVRRLVELHGGMVTATSGGIGQGSELVVTLPRARVGRPAPAVPVPIAAATVIPPRSLRILVVDDEPDLAEGFADLLVRRGHRALAAHDGPEALEAARTFMPEVVLLDLGLPVMDGYEVARRLRAAQGNRKMMLIAVTGYQRDTALLQEAGFDHHLIKPADTRQLLALLATWDEPRPGAATPASTT